MTLDDMMKDDATAIAAQDFGESVTFYPISGVPAAASVISAVVIREEPGFLDEGARVHDATVLVPVDAITGSPTTDDKFDLVLRVGEAAKNVRVSHVSAGDPGFWLLEVRR